MGNLKAGLVQFNIQWEDSPANIAIIEDLVPGDSDVDLIILPEMFNTGFSMNPQRIAQKEDGEAVTWLKSFSEGLGNTIMGSVAIEEKGKFYNRCFVVKNGDIVARYDKHNLFTMAGEELVYSRGDRNITFELNGWKIKPFICYDLRFPVWCHNEDEADLMIFLANWPGTRITHWSALLKARAIENQAFVIGVNRIGHDGSGKNHDGYSSVVSPMGELYNEHINDQGMFTTELNKKEIKDFRSMFNVLQDKKHNDK